MSTTAKVSVGTHWSTSQFARHFDVSRDDVAYWCRAGILATLPRWSEGARWKIPAEEVARIEREGLPPSPRTIQRIALTR